MRVKLEASTSETYYGFKCPGCGREHILPVTGPKAWGFNFDADRPTFTPSILARWDHDWNAAGELVEGKGICHSFVRNGQIMFLSDCTHALAGKTVDLPEIDE